MKPLWTFSELVSASRRDELLTVGGWSGVVGGVAQGCIEFVAAEPRQNAPCLGGHRAFFRVLCAHKDYDAFFNSPVGYRAQYCIGTNNGEHRNREILTALEPACLATIPNNGLPGFPRSFVVASLRATNAKIWISEADFINLSGVHIKYEPWLVKAAAADGGTLGEQAARSKASAGVLAPVGTVLEIKGGWISPGGVECKDPVKADRAYEIHDYGFS